MVIRRAAALTIGVLLGAALLVQPAQATVSEKRVSARMLELTVKSKAMRKTLKVRLLVPKGWSRKAKRTWPIVWALHGGNDRYTAWSKKTDIAALAARRQVLVVMPEGGYAGGYTNWWNYGFGGGPAWETFHLTELRSILEKRYRAGSKRAVLGQSSGGYGALIYAARHPGMFRFAASYSGYGSTLTNGAPDVLMTGLSGLGPFTDKYAMWGHPILQRHIWAAHDPVSKAAGLRGTKLFVSVARHGVKGPLDPPTAQAADPAEAFCWYTIQPFLKRLKQLKIPVTTHLYAKGTHTWPYWKYELHRSWPLIMKSLGA
ncbi:alpha/beta hydrolase family protein [Actinomadura fulvescens]|uniref:Alpha/beta hydrolase family protein n=1 Tax=Actinomadura fulvescens TaxID=46160 RepID=A0ABN3PY90_9ACTN